MILTRPPMGWNTWNTFGENINEELIRKTADTLVESGLRDAGYEYLVIDDCWSERERNPVTGRIVPDGKKFPNGMKSVADYVHSKGLKFGMYSCAGMRTCANYPGSYGHEFEDAQMFAEFGCDYLKYDYCFKPRYVDGQYQYRRMAMALRACGRNIVYSLCNWGSDDVWSWARSAGGDLYRSTGDIVDTFESFKKIALSQLPKLGTSAPGCWNDMDMLTCGMYGQGNVGEQGCNDTEYQTQFALWCLCGVPLMLGCDLQTMSQATKDLVTNPKLLRIDQDLECRPPMVLSWDEDRFALFKLMSDGDFALGFFNMSEKACRVPVYTDQMGIPISTGYGLCLTDVFTGEEKPFQKEFLMEEVPAHGCKVFMAQLVKE